MNYDATKFVNLKAALKELEPFIRDGNHLQTGKPFLQLGGMRSREALANVLMCIVLNSERGSEDFTFTSDPTGGDGIVVDDVSNVAFPTEHVLVPNRDGATGDTERSILEAVDHKRRKGGAAYASGKILVVLSNAKGGEWYPNRIAKQLVGKLEFIEAWVIALQHVDSGDYVYGVTKLELLDGCAPTWLVRICSDFVSWSVNRIQ